MNIEAILSPQLYEGRQLNQSHSSVAVDVLRATSAICAAFAAGASQIVPLDSLEPLPDFRSQGYMIAAERNGMKLYGATCGNSPTEYLTMQLNGAKLAYSTTNGTVSILRASDSDALYVGSFVNLSALANAIVEANCENLVILCSGWKGDPSIEDTLFAGALISRLMTALKSVTLVNDAAMMALDLWNVASDNLYEYCLKATHVHRLMKLGCQADIRWSLQIDACPLVPVYNRASASLQLSHPLGKND